MSVDASPLTIGALAERTDCKVPTIRYYEEIGLLPKAGRRPGGHRFYREADLKRLTFIRRCREFQFPLEKVRELVELQALERSLSQFAENCSSQCAGGPARECVILEDLGSPTSSCC